MANSSLHRFSSIRLLSKILTILLIFEIGTTIYFEIINSEWSFVLTIRQLPNYFATLLVENNLDYFDLLPGFAPALGTIVNNFNMQMGFSLGLGVIVTLVFLLWFYKAYRNLLSLGARAEELRYSPITVIILWFIPILKIWVQYVAMMEIWKVSHPDSDDSNSWRKIPRSKLVVLWWITFSIPSGVLSWIPYVINAQYLPFAEDIALVIHAISSVVSSILLIFILRKISTWQEVMHQSILFVFCQRITLNKCLFYLYNH